METVTKTEVKIVLPFIYDSEPGRLLVDFKNKLGVDFDGLEVKDAYYSSMAEEIVVHAYVDSDRVATLMNKYRKGEPVMYVEKKNVANGRLEVINQVNWW